MDSFLEARTMVLWYILASLWFLDSDSKDQWLSILYLQQALTENKVCGRTNGDQLHGQKMGRGIPWWLIQWLGLHAFTAKGMGSILCLGNKIPHGVAKKKKVGFSRKCARKWGFWPRCCGCPCLCSQRPAMCQSPYHNVFIIIDYFLIHLFYWNWVPITHSLSLTLLFCPSF